MTFKSRYERTKEVLINNKNINSKNRKLFTDFFTEEEKKLKRTNGNANLDEPSYKTLCGYINKLSNVNSWFQNKAWVDLTVKEIEKVYNDLEDGKIVNKYGKRFEDRGSYYKKVFRSLPFELAGKNKEVNEAMKYYTDKRTKEVNFVNAEGFQKIVAVVANPKQSALLWLSWDIGENINTLLQLKKANFKKQKNKEQNEDEYKVWLPMNQLKRSRQPRSEFTLFPETVKYLDIVLQDLGENDLVFPFKYRQALKFFDSAIKRSKVVCEPTGKKPSWKDLRSGMVMNLFSTYSWNSDSINLRLGHNVTSKELEAYFSYGAGKGKETKKLHVNNSLTQLQEQITESKMREKSLIAHARESQDRIGEMEKQKTSQQKDINYLKQEIKKLVDNRNKDISEITEEAKHWNDTFDKKLMEKLLKTHEVVRDTASGKQLLIRKEILNKQILKTK